VTFKEFLFAFTRWVGIDNEDDDDEEENEWVCQLKTSVLI
jgi:calcium-binding protein CML